MSVAENNHFHVLMDSIIDVVLCERPDTFTFYRISTGDSGDGINPVIWNDANPKRKLRPTPKMIGKVLRECYNITDDRPVNRSLMYDETFINNYTYKLFGLVWKRDPNDEEHEYAMGRFRENRKLGVLNDSEIPLSVQGKMETAISALDLDSLPRLSQITSADDIMRSANKMPANSFFKQYEGYIPTKPADAPH